jgi:hypothetical protein
MLYVATQTYILKKRLGKTVRVWDESWVVEVWQADIYLQPLPGTASKKTWRRSHGHHEQLGALLDAP